MSPSSPPTHLVVRRKYASIAAKGGSCCGPQASCCGDAAGDVARGLGYSEDELASLPGEANLGLSCGNPTALAGLKPGEVVLDLAGSPS